MLEERADESVAVGQRGDFEPHRRQKREKIHQTSVSGLSWPRVLYLPTPEET